MSSDRPWALASQAATVFSLRAALMGVSFGSSVLVSRALGPEGRGRYVLPLVAAATVVTLGKLGLEQANVWLLGTRGIAVERVAGQNGLVALAMGGAGVLVVLALPYAMPAVFAGVSSRELGLAALTVPFALWWQLSAGLVTLRGRVAHPFRAELIASCGYLALLLGIFLAGGLNVTRVLAANLAFVAVTALQIGLSARAVAGARPRWDPTLLRVTLRQSLPLHAAMILLFLHLRIDMFMVQAISGSAVLGHYSLAVGLAETLLVAVDSLAIALLPHQVEGPVRESAARALRTVRVAILLGGGVALAWAAIGSPFIRFAFGADFAPAYAPLVALLPGLVLFSVQRLCGAPALRAGRPLRFASIYALSLLGNVALNALWIPRYGALGAGLASSCSYALGALLFLVWTVRLASAREAIGDAR